MACYMTVDEYKSKKNEFNDVSKKIAELTESLRIQTLKLSELKKSIEKVEIIPIIMVEYEYYGLLNGLVDLNRDILMNLIRIVEDEDKVKNLIGMNELFYSWSKLHVFRVMRYKRLNPNPFYISNTHGGFELSKENHGVTFNLVYGADIRRTLFVNKEMNKGLWRLSFQACGYCDLSFNIGVAHANTLEKIMCGLIGKRGIKNFGACLDIWREEAAAANDGELLHDMKYTNKNDDVFAAEVDMDKRTLHFFNETQSYQFPFYFTKLPAPIYFGLGCGSPFTVRFVKLQRPLKSDVDQSTDCEAFEWKKGKSKK